MKKAILVDFNGVMNQPAVVGSTINIVMQLKQEICPVRFKMLAELCVELNAIPISVSSHNCDFVFFELANLLRQDNPELYTAFKVLVNEGFKLTPITYKKEDMEKTLAIQLKDYKVVCFEDNYRFTSFKQIWTNRRDCLTIEHIQKAREYLNS